MNAIDRATTDDELKEMFGQPIRHRDMPGLYLDASVNMLVTELLANQGILFTDAYSQGQGQEKSDLRIAARSSELGLILVTYDRDFREIHTRITGITGLRHAGIMIVAGDALKQDEHQLAAALSRMVVKYEGCADILWNQLFPL